MADTPRMMAPDLTSNVRRIGYSLYLPYGCAILSAALALLVRWLLTPSLGAQFPFATVYFAVTITAWYGGLRPALLATVLGYLGAVYFIIPPYHTFVPHSLTDYIGTGIYFFVSLTSALFSEAQHKARAQAESGTREARNQEVAVRESEAQKGAILTQQRFLAEASDLLASSLDYQTTLQSVAQLVVPQLADWCVIHLLDEEGNLELVTVVHVDPAKIAVARESSRRYPPRKDEPGGLAAVARTGKSEWLEDIPVAALRTTAQDEEHYRMLTASGMRSYLCVPLVARGKTLGTLTLIGGESGHRYTADSLPLAEELARRAAIAVDNARLYAAAQKEIKERQQAEQALEESRNYYRTLTEAVPQLVWTTQPDGVPDYFNQQWLDYTGQKFHTSGAWWKGGVHPDDLALTMERWTTAVQTGELYEVEYRLKGASGAFRWFLARGIPLKNDRGEIVKWFGSCTDIDQQKRIEQTQRLLAEMSARIRSLSDPAEVLWSVVNAIGEHLHVTHCSYADIDADKNLFNGHRAYRMDDRTLDSRTLDSRTLDSRTLDSRTIDGVFPSGPRFPLDVFGAGIVTAMKAGRTVVVNDTQTDLLVRHLYETVFQPGNIRAFISVPLIKEGRWIAALSVTMHGEPRAWGLDEIGLLEKVMEQTWLAVENVRLYQAERERSEQLTLAIQEVHHRVKNSLQAVSALLEMQIDPDTAMLPIEAVQDSLGQIKTIALVHDLLARDKPMGKVNIAQVLTNLAKLLSSGMRGREHLLPIQVEVEPVWMSTKAATSLALVINELLTNAAKHNICVDREEETGYAAIEVSLQRQAGNIVVSVQDHGPGFPPNFDPVMDAHIGLQLVLTLVEHDLYGTITFSNRVDSNRIDSNRAGSNRAGSNCIDQGKAETAHGGRVEIVFSEQSIPE